MKTREDARNFLITAIEAGGEVKDAAAEYDLEAILDQIYTYEDLYVDALTPCSWDLGELDLGVFWGTIKTHAR